MSYTYCHALSLHDALPMSHAQIDRDVRVRIRAGSIVDRDRRIRLDAVRGLGRRQRNLAHRHADAVAAADIDLATGRERLAHVGRQLVGLVEDVLGHCVHRRYLEGTAKGMNAYDTCTSQAFPSPVWNGEIGRASCRERVCQYV